METFMPQSHSLILGRTEEFCGVGRWANESDTTKNDVAKGWAGIQVIIMLNFSKSRLFWTPLGTFLFGI